MVTLHDGPPNPDTALPADLAAVQADDALLDALGDPTPPVAGTGDQLAQTLMAWRREVDLEPVVRVLDVDTALAAVRPAGHPHRRWPGTPRWAHRIRAWAGGWFWSLCPSCEEYFGGHEVTSGPHYHSIPTGQDSARAICPACTARGVGCRAHAQLRGTYHGGCEFTPLPPLRDGLEQ